MSGIYIHIPFCKQACSYCDFHFATSLKYKEDILKAIQKEIILAKDFISDKTIESVYFGGGTPSLLHPEEIASIIETIDKNYILDNVKEWTLEANPDDLSDDYLRKLKKTTPVNRLSIGIQSFIERDLKLMNRAHDEKQAHRCIPAAQDFGFENLSCDLIFGTPNLLLNELKMNMDTLIQHNVSHISTYALTIEQNTPLYKKTRLKEFKPSSDKVYEEQMWYVMDYLEMNGYEHYEISNFAKDGFHAIHNTNYWKQIPYWGFGPSAHGYNGDIRRWNIRNNQKYMQAILRDNVIPYEEEHLSIFDKINEYIMTSLRTKWGLSLNTFKNLFGEDNLSVLLQNASTSIDTKQIILHEEVLYLSRESKIISDTIMSELFFI